MRGTDYIATKLHDHNVQPSTEDVIAKTIEAMKEHNFDYVYLSTEDKNIIAKFQDTFKDKLLLPEGVYVDFDSSKNIWISEYSTGRENDKYLQGLEYIVSKLLLAECDGAIMSITNGTAAIMCMTQKTFDYLYVFNLGYYC